MEGIAEHWDAIVVGGGPAGSTTAAVLAERGWRVLLVEKTAHPRFHIGESLLPQSEPVFERLGVADAVAAIGQRKEGAVFISPWHEHEQAFYFDGALDRRYPSAWQVRRAELDAVLFDNAARRGATSRTGWRVCAVEPGDDTTRVTLQDADGIERRLTCRQLVDATGRDALLARKGKGLQRNRLHNTAAVYAHFAGARLDTGRDRGNIRLYWFDEGWLWFIPFRDGEVSVGAVCWPSCLKRRRGGLDAFLAELIARCPDLAERLADARTTRPAEATGNYAYRARALTGRNWVLVGDAYAFVDPVFSSGVHVALHSALMGADVVDARLAGHRLRAAWAAWRYHRRLKGSLRLFTWFIYRISQPAMRQLFMGPRNYLRMREAVVSLLAGDVYARTRITPPLLAFRLFYYAFYLGNWRENRLARQRRRAGMGLS